MIECLADGFKTEKEWRMDLHDWWSHRVLHHSYWILTEDENRQAEADIKKFFPQRYDPKWMTKVIPNPVSREHLSEPRSKPKEVP
jgi:hypothetical protein